MFGKTAIDSGTDKIAERLPKNHWTSPPEYLEYQEVITQVGSLSAQESTLKHLVKKSTGEKKEELIEKLVEVQAELLRAKAAQKLLDAHADMFKSYLWAIGKVF